MASSILDLIATYNPSGFAQQNQLRQQAIQQGQLQQQEAQQDIATKEVQNRMLQRQMRDQDIFQRALVNTDQSPQAIRRYLAQNGISGPGFLEANRSLQSLEQNAAKLKAEEIAAQKAAHEQVGNILQGIQEAPADQRAALWAQAQPQLAQLEPGIGIQAPDDTRLNYLLAAHGFAGKLLDQTLKRQQAATSAAQQKSAEATAAKTQAELPGVQAEAQQKQQTAQSLMGMGDADWRAAIDEVIPDKNTALYKRTISQVNFYRKQGNLKAANEVINKAAEQLGSTERAVATAQATAPIRINVAAQSANARAPHASSDALDLMAENALAGQMPSSRNPVLYAQVMDRAAELAKDRGLTAQQAVLERNAAQANKSAYNAVVKQYETLKPFADMAEKNADILEQKAKAVSNLGAPFLNTPLRALQQRFFGNKDVAAFQAALLPVQADFARILNSPTAAGVLSDTARSEMQAAISPGATVGQIRAALDVFRQDAKNRRESYEAQLQDLKQRTVVRGDQALGGEKKATHRYNPATGKIEEIR